MLMSLLSRFARRRTRPWAGWLALPVALLTAGIAPAQQSGSLSSAPADKAEAFRKNVTLLGIPPATVAPDGLVFASLSWTDKRSGVFDDPDGSAAIGFGLGVMDGALDLQFTAHITSLEDDFADSGYFTVRASHRIDSGGTPTYIGVGASQLAAWGDATDQDIEGSVSVTSFPVVSMGGDLYPLMLTLGAGSNVRNFDRDPGVFVGAGIGLSEAFGTSVAWNGDNVDLGASFRIKGLDNLGFNVVLSDAFDQDDRQRFILSVNWIKDNVF